SPSSVTAGAPAFDLTLSGSLFRNGDRIRFNGTPFTTSLSSQQCFTDLKTGFSFCGFTQATATIPASMITTPGTAQLSVLTTDGVLSSNVIDFFINQAPVISSLNPSSARTGAPAFTLQVLGSNFSPDPATGVNWNGAPLATTFVSATQLNAAVPANLLSSPGTANITLPPFD